ncbi:Dipeptidyl aminopeptidase/acylaminoacyl peptidase [Jatrophihabitans endophyticus]|uniref:Dipeptidyl aminopeptidase/acylaminoacyl peptidase n=1 Tax=Jatrophihabitans endophyticus TaxID=1206085 RepID=A0A1M5S234_9ACTN|nr:prolyl oligopeptidase family serine peptidase [Jatrophihabitans endophyticus]SHH32505.1 Dipeptidyl aminopeptidase/acylaminoacyl peptidase [Jatrophihabitans endophyticus]
MSPFAANELLTLPLTGVPALHPDGATVAVPVHVPAPDGRGMTVRLEVRRADRGPRVTAEADQPAFSPDGRTLACRTAVGRRIRVSAFPDGPVRLLDPAPVASFAWLDDTRLVALVETPAAADETGTYVDWLRYRKDGRSGALEPARELWLVPLSGPARPLATAPGSISAWAARGDRLVYCVEPLRSDDPAPGCDLHVVDLATGTDDVWWRSPVPLTAVALTGLGAHVVAVGNLPSGQSVDPPEPWRVTPDGGHRLFADADGVACERAIVSDGRAPGPAVLLQPVPGTDELLALDTDGDDVVLWLVDAAADRTATRRRLTPPGRSVTGFGAAQGRHVAVCLESATQPGELQLLPLDGGDVTALPGGASSWAAGWSFADAEALPATSADGLAVPSLLWRAGPGARPLVVRLHGGPHLAHGRVFDVETQVLVAAGYSVLMPSMRGSAGRGRDVRALSVGAWGRGDVADVHAAVDAAIACGAADPARLYLTGGSYGGFLVNSVLTGTDRFRAAVSERSVSNLVSKFGTSDNGFTTNRFELGTDILDDAAAVWERSPLASVDRIRTPLLLVHGEDDHRCPIEQSEQLFVALRRLGRDCAFLRIPGESHSLPSAGRPDRRVRRLAAIVGWLADHE